MMKKSKILTGVLLLGNVLTLPVCASAFAQSNDAASVLFSPQSYQSFAAQEVAVPVEEVENPDNAPVALEADQVEYDQRAEIVTAFGGIELVQNGRVLNADQISYDMKRDVVVASGNVRLMEVTGEEYFADNFELTDQMKDGVVRNLRGQLPNGGRFIAEEGEKVQDTKIYMRKATYTACEPCKNNPKKAPIWQLKARDIEHDKEAKRVSYKDATFELKGVPVVYMPYFSHADGTVKRKSGFLTPSIGFDSQLGTNYQQEYYWNIAPDKDATIGLAAFTQEAPLATSEYRQRFENAELMLNGGVTYSGRTDRNGNTEFAEDNEARGHIFGDATWNVSEKWRAGAEVAAVSDKQYLRQYNISNKDVLENKIYAERFSDRNYALAQAIKFKDVRVSSASADQPDVLPEFYTRLVGDPNATLGGRWHVEASGLGLRREGNEQDVARGGVEAGWRRLFSSDAGLVTTVETSVRADAYKTDDLTVLNNEATDGSALRGFANTHVKTSLPLQKRFETSHAVIEPLAAVTIGTNLNDNSNIPNEDSQDVFLDSTNLFNANRFPGLDRIEDKTHATYGVRMGIHADDGKSGEIFLGQSYRFDDDDKNPFPNGSGLEERESDFVGAVKADLGQALQLNYGLQLKNDSFTSQRHEVDASSTIGPVKLGARYFYADALEGTNLNTRREQIRSTARYDFTDRWALYGGLQYDLARETEGLRQALYGLDYDGQCVTFNVNAKRNLTSNSSGDSGTQIMMRIGLKTLGEFETSAFTIGGREDNDDDEEDDLEDTVNNP